MKPCVYSVVVEFVDIFIRKQMSKLIKIVFMALLLSFTTLSAQHKHDKSCLHKTLSNEVSYEVVQKAAISEVKRLVTEKKISKSWNSVPILKIGRTHYGDNDDWIVIFNNPKIKKKSRQNLYIFVSKRGEIRGANYTGN